MLCVLIFSRRNNNNGDGRERRSLVGVGRRVGDVVDRRQTVRRLSNRSVLSFLFRFLLLFGWLVGLHILAGPAARLLLGYVVVIFKRGQVIFITEHKQQGRRRPFSFRELLLGCSIKEQNSPADSLHHHLISFFSSSSSYSSSPISQGFGYLGNRPPFDCQSFRPTAVQSVLLCLFVFSSPFPSSALFVQQQHSSIQQTQEQHQSKGIAFGCAVLTLQPQQQHNGGGGRTDGLDFLAK